MPMLAYGELVVLKAARGDLLADDVSADEVLLGQAQPHLLEDKVNLLLLVHGPESLDLHTMRSLACHPTPLDMWLVGRRLGMHYDRQGGRFLFALGGLSNFVRVVKGINLHAQHASCYHAGAGEG